MEDDTQYTGTDKKEGTKKSEADDVRESVKQTVSKGVAAVAGALKGFSEEAKKNDLAGAAKQAVQKAGETTRELAGTAKKEFQQTRDHLKGGGLASKPMGDPMGGSSSGPSGVPDLRKTPLGTQSDIKEKSGSSYVGGSKELDKEDDDADSSTTLNDSH